ncbi:MAG: EAL domain-containing protein [Candidatus Thiodiazotropha sp. DIVDIV]
MNSRKPAGVLKTDAETDLYRELTDVLDLGIAVYQAVDGGKDFIFVEYNPAAERMDKTKRDSVIGNRLTEVFPGVVEFGLMQVLQRVWKSGLTETFPPREYRDGRIKGWRENRIYKLANNNVVAAYEDVTAREEARVQREATDERYRLLTDSTLDGVWDWDLISGELYLSPRWKEQLGYMDDELPNELETWKSRLHPDDRDGVLTHLDHFLRNPEKVWSDEFRLLHKKGYYVWTMARGTPVINDDGVVQRILGVHIDVEDRKKFEQRLADNEQRLTLALSAANQGLYDLNVQTGEAIVNQEYATMLGYDSSTFKETNASWLERMHPDDHEAVAKTYSDYIGGRKDEYRVEFRLRTASGKWVWILSIGRLVEWDSDGKPLRMLGTHTDITALKQAQERVRQAAQVFSSTIEGVTITDLNGTILDVNKAFSDITGYSREEAIGHNPSILKSGRHDANFYVSMWKSLLEDGSWRGEIWNRNKQGVVYPEILTISQVFDDDQNPTGYVAVFSDITTSKQTEERMDFMAHHDPLTQLPNRLLFNARLEQAIQRSTRENQALAVMFIDLDRFKQINDSFGHSVGDELLLQCAVRLQTAVRGNDTVGRISGDEFVILLENIKSSENVSIHVRKVIQLFNEPFLLADHEITVTCSIGISLFPDDCKEPSCLLRNADTAMYLAKEEGRNGYQFYTHEMTTAAAEYLFMENALHQALRENQFYLVYQPQIELSNGDYIGVEALIRWQHPEQGVIPPSHFIPVTEKTGLIQEIGEWVLKEACRQASEWKKRGLDFRRIAVNISGRQVQNPDFSNFVISTLEEYNLSADCLELEVTESFLMEHEDEGIRQLRVLQEAGITIAIDDFGTGYSSLSYLKYLPVNKLKIDRSFVRDIPDDSNDMAISEAVIALGGALGLDVIGEGIETEEQVAFLKAKGCALGQGFYYYKPLSVEDIESLCLQQ